jgi:homoserine kinase
MKRSDSPPMERVVVRAPATIANLGPGFDCLGLALAWHNEVGVERDLSGGLSVTVAGQGAADIPRDETNLVVRAIASVAGSAHGLRVHLTNAIPFGRGFGSSSAAIVAGLIAGRALQGESWEPADLVRAGAEIEGHADNVAPCASGGVCVVSGRSVLALRVPPEIEVIACVAPITLSTEAARRALPADVAFADAVANSGRAALLTAALAVGDASHLLAATEDVLHQPARFSLAPDSGALVTALRREGIAAFLAGAGPSVGALVPSAQATDAEAAARRFAADGWDVRRVAIDARGATVVEGAPALA